MSAGFYVRLGIVSGSFVMTCSLAGQKLDRPTQGLGNRVRLFSEADINAFYGDCLAGKLTFQLDEPDI